MGIKKKFSMGVMSAALGLALVGGGTYAYFSDSEVTNNTFAAGVLDLSVAPTEIINVDNIKPGDSFMRDFELTNNGTLDISTVTLGTSYSVIDYHGDNWDDFGKHIQVEFLYNVDNFDEVIFETTLEQLKGMSPEAISQNIFYPEFGEKGLPVGSTHDLIVKFTFLDNGQDQNQFQNDSLRLEWTFTALQTEGEAK